MRAVIASGALFPDYEMTSRTVKRREFSEMQWRDAMIVGLTHGGYSEVGYGRRAIGVYNPAAKSVHRSGAGSSWVFLSDAEYTYCRRITTLPPRRGQNGYAKTHAKV
jgi:hypothetical protein